MLIQFHTLEHKWIKKWFDAQGVQKNLPFCALRIFLRAFNFIQNVEKNFLYVEKGIDCGNMFAKSWIIWIRVFPNMICSNNFIVSEHLMNKFRQIWGRKRTILRYGLQKVWCFYKGDQSLHCTLYTACTLYTVHWITTGNYKLYLHYSKTSESILCFIISQ